MATEERRALVFRVDEAAGRGGIAAAGKRVDVLVSRLGPAGAAISSGRTVTLLQKVPMLSADQVSQVASLLVTPAQAEILSLAAAHGSIQLALRNPPDATTASDRAAAMEEASPAKTAMSPKPAEVNAPAPEPSTPPQGFVVETIHGARRLKTRFESQEEAQP
jgi:pilus assembly protein CpaB